MTKLIDISQKLMNGIPVWTGDTEFQTFWKMEIEKGASCNVGSVTMSLHTGTHADAPRHFQIRGLDIAEMNLETFIGPAYVLDLTKVRFVEKSSLEKLIKHRPERVLFRTMTANKTKFDGAFSYIAPDAAKFLADLKIKLVGVDTPSVDKSDSKALETHKILAEHNIAILENLDLDDVTEGTYELIAFPLKLAGMDASPVRAVLRTL